MKLNPEMVRHLTVAAIVSSLASPVAAADERKVTGITIVKSVTASSTLAAKDPKRYAPERALDALDEDHDQPPDSAWCEGKPDEGLGESLTIELDAPAVLASVTLKAGFWKSEALFRSNNRVTGVDLLTDGGRSKSASFGPEMEDHTIELGGAPTRTLTVKLTKVKKGRMNDTCITHVALTTAPETQVVIGMDPQLAQAIVRVEKALAKCDAKALAAAVRFPLTWVSDTNEETKYDNAAALAKACKRDDRALRFEVPGYDRSEKRDLTLLTDGGCGADCMQWGLRKSDGWKLVWVGPVWTEPKP